MNNLEQQCEDVFAQYQNKEITRTQMLGHMTKILGIEPTVEIQKDYARVITVENDFFISKI